MPEKPRYEHDCATCTFLGRDGSADLYFCPNGPTVIARFSNDGSDYVSGLVFAARIPYLGRAVALATARNLL